MKVVAVMVTYNGNEWIEKSIGSLIQSSIPVQVVVVDNNSSDNTLQNINSHFPDVVIFRNTENLGFGKANNIGIRYALDSKADFVFLINQDAWVKRNAIEELIKISVKHPGYILSPIHLNAEGSKLDYGFSSYITPITGDILNQKMKGQIAEKEIYPVKFVNAALWLIAAKNLEKIGGFDPLFFHYEEDADLINRARFHDIKIGICPNIIGYHGRKQENKKGFFYKEKEREKNMYFLLLKNIQHNFFSCMVTFSGYFLKANIKNLATLDFKSFISDYSVLAQVLIKLPIIIKHRKINKTLPRSFL